MTIEIQRPELEALILQRMQSGGFHNVEDVLMQALTASPVVAEKSRDRRTGADLIAALQASPIVNSISNRPAFVHRCQRVM